MYSQIDSNRRKTWLLIAFFIGILSAIGWFYGYVYSNEGYAAVVVALLISLGMTLVSWFASDKIALSMHRAKEITSREQLPQLWNTVENLAITAGTPMPRVYVVDDASPNAFATGRNPEHASIAVTTGLLQRLEKTELEGVLAHELSHIKNYDIRVMTVVIVLVGAITILGDLFLRTSFLGGGKREKSENGHPVFLILGVALLILAPIAGKLIQFAVSRKREYLADASGALLTRYPEGLARALEKIRDSHTPLQTASTSTNHLWISEPMRVKTGKRIASLFSTHPPIEDRIAKLRGMGDN